jgi:pyruvate, orthophosphate dikinase
VPAEGWSSCARRTRKVYKKHTGEDFPQDPFKQLEAVDRGGVQELDGPRRPLPRVENIRGLLGTAVNVQSMVYGNMGDDSGTGVAFTRNPSPARTSSTASSSSTPRAKTWWPASARRSPSPRCPSGTSKEVYKQLLEIKKTLEKHYKDMQDIEFTIERGKLFMLQTRTGKRTGARR